MNNERHDKYEYDEGEEGRKSADVIPARMWFAALLIALQSFSFGYVFSCLNACLVAGNDNDPHECIDGEDSSCPTGTIYRDIYLDTGAADELQTPWQRAGIISHHDVVLLL